MDSSVASAALRLLRYVLYVNYVPCVAYVACVGRKPRLAHLSAQVNNAHDILRHLRDVANPGAENYLCLV